METILTTQPGEVRTVVSRRQVVLLSLVGLLLAEVLVLTLRFDSQSLVDAGVPFVGYAKYLPQALMAIAASALVFGGPGLFLGSSSGLAEKHGRGVRSALYLAGHLASFIALLVLTGALWEGSLGRSPGAPIWVAVWLVTGLASVGFWLAAILPAEAWAALVRRSSGVILAALAVGALACYAGRLTMIFLGPLNAATLGCVRLILGLIAGGGLLQVSGQVIGLGSFQVEVASECAGFEGIGLIWVFLSVYLWFFRRSLRFPQALWLLPAGTLVIWMANVARIVALVLIGAWISPKIALGGFHSQAGWLAFNGVALGLVALSRRARIFATDSPINANTETNKDTITKQSELDFEAISNPTAAYLGPLLALVASVMVTTALSAGTGFDAFYPARLLAVAAALWACRRGYASFHASWSWPAVGIGLVVFVVWMALEPASHGSESRGLAEGLAQLPGPLAACWLIARVLGSVVTVPIAEELAFRGFLLRRLISADFTTVSPRKFTWLSCLASSILFGLLHQRLLAGSLAGVFYALAVYRKGDLSEAVLAHATTNALIAAYVLTTGSWSLWV